MRVDIHGLQAAGQDPQAQRSDGPRTRRRTTETALTSGSAVGSRAAASAQAAPEAQAAQAQAPEAQAPGEECIEIDSEEEETVVNGSALPYPHFNIFPVLPAGQSAASIRFNNRRFPVVVRTGGGETVRGGKMYHGSSGYFLKCTKNHTKNDTCLECGAKGCILERGYNDSNPETIPGPDNCGVCADCAQKYVFGNKSMCKESGCEGLIAERDHNGSKRENRGGYCSFHQDAFHQAGRAEAQTGEVSIARNRRRRQPAPGAAAGLQPPAPTTGRAELPPPAPTTGQAGLNQTGYGDEAREITFCGIEIKIPPDNCTRNCGGNENCGKDHEDDGFDCRCGWGPRGCFMHNLNPSVGHK